MSFKIHTSFMDSGLDAAQVEQHIGDVLDEAVSGSDRQKVLSHFYQTLAQDEEQLLKHRQVVAQAKRVLSAKSLLHRFDFSKHPGLFNVDGSDRWTRMKAKLSTDGEDVRGKAGLVISEQVYINGDNIMLDGISSGSAVDGTLTCGTTCNGTLRIQGSGVHVRGIHFKSADQYMVEFITAASNITLEDCIFECTGGADTRFWYGADADDPSVVGGIVSGNCTIKNCLVKNFTSWMLIDFNTSSSVPSTALDTVSILDNKFVNCAGSIAARGKADDPMKLFDCRRNVFEYGSAQHALFWSAVEANEVRRVICTDNTATGVKSGSRGFLQAWSKHDLDWELMFKDNTVSGFIYGLQLAISSGFKNPDYTSDRHLIRSEAGKFTNVDYGMSLNYPWDSGTFAPDNSARFPSQPTHSFADGLTVVAN